MSIRCGCPDEGDATVFGPLHRCSVVPVIGNPCGRSYHHESHGSGGGWCIGVTEEAAMANLRYEPAL